MADIETLLGKFEQLRNEVGWFSAGVAILLLLTLFFVGKFLSKKIEKSAEEASEKTIKTFQAKLDRELAEHNVKFSATHQKQIDAIHEIYIRLQKLFRIIDFIMHGDKYYQELQPHRELKALIAHRTDFIKVYGLHKIVLPVSVCLKIDSLVPSVEYFIDTYKSGLFPEDSRLQSEEPDHENERNELLIAGIWKQEAFDETLEKLASVKGEIESEFRKIYGT
jgi:hypothetical protein